MRIAAIESLVLACLLLLAAFVLWDAAEALGVPDTSLLYKATRLLPGPVYVDAVLAASLCVAAYWGLQTLGRMDVAFWLMALLVIAPHGVPLWDYNQLEWYELVGVDGELVGARSPLRDAALFLACLAGLAALHRIGELRVLDRRMTAQGVAAADRLHVALCEGLMLGGLIAAGLLLAFFMVLAAGLLGRYDDIIGGSPWAVVAVGGGATVLLALTLLLWYRGARDRPA